MVFNATFNNISAVSFIGGENLAEFLYTSIVSCLPFFYINLAHVGDSQRHFVNCFRKRD